MKKHKDRKARARELLGTGKTRIGVLLLLLLFGALWTWFFLPVPIYLVLNLGNGAGMLFFGGAFLVTLFRKKAFAFLRRLWEKRPGKLLLSLFLALLLTGLTYSGVMTAKIFAAAEDLPPEDTPVTVVVLGCKVMTTGRPSLMLSRRLNAALAFLEAHPGTQVIVSGGQGDDEPRPEAEAMAEFLIAAGLDPARVIEEDRSTSTRENVAFSKAIIEERGLPEAVLLVTNEFHQYRAGLLAEAGGIEEHYAVSGASPVVLLPTYVARELFGIVYEAVRK